ncbi:DnaD domain-containing protein [Cohnella sp. JJ-181]|uniref:DnaD domain-containing protein n=1 Tax=Cohnella rhizoplanae TaxID=2974897 RepID=UPI0022FFC005|nr:DnaD domain protein [Cohnella sp. JJ-181]CAI6081068.1 DNA replication protein DnaD [Cohnella sp. JJ-181]
MNEAGGMAATLAEAYMDGSVSVPYALLRVYRMLALTDTDCMLLIQLIAFRQLEQNDFPTIEQLQQRLGAPGSVIGESLQKLIRRGLVAIDESSDPLSGVRAERYNLFGLFQAVAQLLVAGEAPLRTEGSASFSAAQTDGDESDYGSGGRSPERSGGPKPEAVSLFAVFEREFGRPISPMEAETIAGWLDQDKYAEELILFALKESVFAGKLSFRYMDRILLEWSRNRVRSVEDARAHAQRFRAGR